MDIVINLITSTIVVGIFVFIFKESYKAKINNLNKQIDSIRAYHAKDFDKTIVSIDLIWQELCKLDDYFCYDFALELPKNIYAVQSIRSNVLEIKKLMALLPDSLYGTTNGFISSMITNLNDFTGKYIEMAQEVNSNEKNSNEKNYNENLDKANAALTEFKVELSQNLKSIRNQYRDYISTHNK